MRFHWTEKLLPFESVPEKEKMRKTVSSSRNKIFFLKYRPPCNCNNGFQKNLNERISSALNRKSVATGCNEEFF